MIREPFCPSPTAVASGPPRSGVPQQFEVVFQAPSADEAVVLQAATDADTATMAFHQALRHLRVQQATGELLVRSSDPARLPHLRQPVTTHQIPGGYQTHE